MTDSMSFDIELPTVAESDGERIACDTCGKMVSPRGMTRHVNSAHGTGPTPAKQRLAKGRTRKTKGLSAEVSEGLASVAGKMLFLITLIMAWSALRRANIPDPTGEQADMLALTEDESVAIGRPLARMFASSSPGRRLAPVIVENEDAIDAVFAVAEWYKRQRQFFDQFNPQDVHEPSAGRSARNGSNGQTTPHRAEGEGTGTGLGYIPPSPVDLLGA